jgi:hypothetical protein
MIFAIIREYQGRVIADLFEVDFCRPAGRKAAAMLNPALGLPALGLVSAEG